MWLSLPGTVLAAAIDFLAQNTFDANEIVRAKDIHRQNFIYAQIKEFPKHIKIDKTEDRCMGPEIDDE